MDGQPCFVETSEDGFRHDTFVQHHDSNLAAMLITTDYAVAPWCSDKAAEYVLKL
eukprot:m.118133 g.118133  ORF g.118133 m.118133 type:complete len:55 (-) comp13642_c2_seq1:574-738(-)